MSTYPQQSQNDDKVFGQKGKLEGFGSEAKADLSEGRNLSVAENSDPFGGLISIISNH